MDGLRARAERSAPRVMGGVMVACLIALIVASPLRAQRKSTAPFSRFLPSSVRVYVKIRDLAEMNEALTRAHAWRLFPLLTGQPFDRASKNDLRTAVTNFFGSLHAVNADAVMNAEVAIVSTSLSHLSQGVWLARLPDAKALDQWFPKDRRLSEKRIRSVHWFRMRGGLFVCVRDGVVALARRHTNRVLLREIQKRMILGADAQDALEQSEIFQEFMTHLPGGPLGFVYFSKRPTTGRSGRRPALLLPDIGQALIGLYERDGQVDLTVRASLLTPRVAAPLSTKTKETFLRLPQTTLFAMATTVNFANLYHIAQGGPSSGALRRYLTLVEGLGKGDSSHSSPLGKVGPEVMMVWGQDLSKAGSVPQLAVMLHCTDATAVRAAATRLARNVIGLIRVADPVPADAAPTFKLATYLGTAIVHVPLRAYASQSKFPFVRLLAGGDPAWASWHDWFIVALSREHVERILDAQSGLVPRVATMGKFRGLHRGRAERTSLAVTQGALASDVLDRWLKAVDAGSSSLLAPHWWQPTDPSTIGLDTLFGFVLERNSPPGAAVIARIDPDGAARGRLRPKDRILGVGGRVLDLSTPARDLRNRLLQNSSPQGPTLRVRRGEKLIDVVLPPMMLDSPMPNLPVQPAEAVRELASLGRTVQTVTLVVHAVEKNRFSARLSLRFLRAD